MSVVRHASWLALAAALAVPSAPASATEAAAGHYVTGVAAGPGAGIAPPPPGHYWSNVNPYYTASASSSLQLPVAGNIVTGLDIEFVSAGLTAIYVPPVKLGPFTIATGSTVAGQYVRGTATLGARSRRITAAASVTW